MRPFLLLTFFLLGLSLQAQNIILEDNFEKDNYNLSRNKENFNVSINDKALFLENTHDKNTKWSLIDVNKKFDSFDFDVQATMSLEKAKSETAGYGLVWACYNDYSNYHVVNLNQKKQNQMYWYYNKKFSYDLNWTDNNDIKSKKENTIRVSKRAQKVSVFVNDKLIMETSNTVFYGDKFGFILEPNTTIKVTNLKITEFPSAIDVVDTFDASLEVKKMASFISADESIEKSPVISPDGQTLYFERKHDKENIETPDFSDAWYSTLENGEWGKPKNMGRPINNKSHNFVVSVSPDNNRLLVGNTYSSDGMAFAGQGVSISTKTENGWSVPQTQSIKNFVNKNKYVGYSLVNDNKTLIMAIENPNCIGLKDLFVSFLQKDNTWSEPKSLGNVVNTNKEEACPFMASDGKTLYFSSVGHPGYGGYDLFVTKRLDDSWTNWSKPKNLGNIINSKYDDLSICITAKGDKAYLGRGKDLFEITNTVKQEPVVLVKGKVYDSKTSKILNAPITYNDLKTGAELGIAVSDINTGSYSIILPFGKAYSFMAEKKGYYAVTQNVDLTDLKEYKEVIVDLYLNPIEKGQTIRLNNIFFDSGKYDLLPESDAELNKLYTILQENKQLKIEIAGHTDAVGIDKDNLILSKNRANAVMQFLLNKGVNKNRLTANGYGETKFIATNDTPEGKQQNRRVEFLILEL